MDGAKKRKISHKQPQAAPPPAAATDYSLFSAPPPSSLSDFLLNGVTAAVQAAAAADEDSKPSASGIDVRPLRSTRGYSLGTASGSALSSDQQIDSGEQQQPDMEQQEKHAAAWQVILDSIPRCSALEGLRETSFFRNKYQPAGGGRNACLRKLLQELGSLEESLPTDPAIWVRFDEETPQFMRALITAPSGTPYALGLFCFDLFIPDHYPSVAPKVRLLTTGGGTVRFSPNLYENGTVCLSLLGTWSGPKWNPLHSTILQVLVSIQGLILGVEHPYYLEPGFGGWEESIVNHKGAHVPPHVKSSDAKIREGTVKYAMLETCKATPRYLHAFQDVITAHFTHHKESILKEVRGWGKIDRAKRPLQQAIAQLQEEFAKLKDDDSTKKAPVLKGGSGKASANGSGDNGEDPYIATKRHAMEQAATNGDFVTAGQLQAEIQFIQSKGVDALVAVKRSEMDEAAAKRDYITAGQLQQRVQYLEQHKRRLQELPRRMFEAAARHDFVRAGRFQEQYQILLDSNDTTDAKTSSSATAAANPAAMWDQGTEGPSYTFYSSLPVGSAAGFGSAAGLDSAAPKPIFHHPDYALRYDSQDTYDDDEDEVDLTPKSSFKKAVKKFLGKQYKK
uniref:UBC core domain-containing protein n=1 Tax=Amphora coffeiformis TaxID=265554 RepID=A0A7S3KY03_9STRA